MLSEKRGESIFLNNKTKVSLKVIYFKGKKPYTHLTLIHTSTLHIFLYAYRKKFKVDSKKGNLLSNNNICT